MNTHIEAMSFFPAKPLQLFQCFAVVDIIHTFRCLKAKSDICEGGVIHDGPKAGPAYLSFPENFVAIQPVSKRTFAVVQVNANDLLP